MFYVAGGLKQNSVNSESTSQLQLPIPNIYVQGSNMVYVALFTTDSSILCSILNSCHSSVSQSTLVTAKGHMDKSEGLL